jgi:phosphoglycerate dehydrogenase-like enzyme
MHVAVLDDYQGRAHEFADWDSLGVTVHFFRETIPREDLPRTLAGFDALVLMRERTRFPREILEQLPDLKLVITTGRRNAAVDADYLRERGIVYCGTGMRGLGYEPSAGVPSTVEVAWALILATAKRVVPEDRALRGGRWQVGLPMNLAGTTLGLLGLGRLGSAMVAPAKAFGMEVIAWSQNLTAERAAEAGAVHVSKDELFARADFLSIHLILSHRSRGLVGAAELAAMKSTAVLINTSRGPIVDEAALIEALSQGSIGGAGLDVFDTEPLPADHRLLKLENTVLLPHLGYVSEAGMRAMYAEVVEGIAAYLQGAPIGVIS